jgi:plasmid stabilization system protein ParE
MRVRYAPRAKRDIERIYNYLEQRSPTGARSLTVAIRRRIASLGIFPFMAPYNAQLDLYELTIIGHPYKVYYRIKNESVMVIHVRHTARRPLARGDA